LPPLPQLPDDVAVFMVAKEVLVQHSMAAISASRVCLAVVPIVCGFIIQ